MTAVAKKFQLVLIIASALGVLLLYTTKAFPLIGAATGVSFGLSVRLYFMHKQNGFAGTKQLDWVLLSVLSAAAFVLMFIEKYDFQAVCLIVVFIRSLLIQLMGGTTQAAAAEN